MFSSPPGTSQRGVSVAGLLGTLLLLAAIAATVAWAWVNRPLQLAGATAEVSIEPGTPVRDIVRLWHDAGVQTSPETQERVDDDQCDDDSDYNGTGTGFFWYYLAARSVVPAVGQTATGGTFNGRTLTGTVQRGGLPTTGGSTVKSATTKGGFGGSSRGFG